MLDSFKNKFQLRFKNRTFAAKILAGTLEDSLKKMKVHKKNDKLLILGIPRGGVIVADIVASKLRSSSYHCDFDIVIPRKLTDMDNKEQAIGAIMEDGTTYLDEELIFDLQIDTDYLKLEKEKQLQEIERRKSLYRNHHPPYEEIINDKIVILVDDGAASGSTVIVAARWLKKNFEFRKLVIALPVVPKKSMELLQNECDLVVSVTTPSKYFHSVAQYYNSFNQVSDEEVIEIIQKNLQERTNI
jgi:predicted phosphoribosyltransferase